MSIIFWILAILSAIFVVFLLWLWGMYNSFVKSRNEVKADFADIDVQLKRRAGLIENLVEVVKNYAKHESTTFEKVTEARSALNGPLDPEKAARVDNMLSSTLRSLFAVSEAYPDLKASENYKILQADLKETEDKIAAYREQYNKSVLAYNTKVQIFPNLLVASLFGFKEQELFEATDEDRADVEIAQPTA